MYVKRVLSIILLLLLAISFFSCASANGKNKVEKDETTAVTSEKASQYAEIFRERDDKLPENLDFGGEKIHILCLDKDYYKNEIATDELNSEPLNDAIYTRNLTVSERLNVEITTESAVDNATNKDALVKSINSGDDTYQIYADGAAALLQDAMDGYFYNLCDIENCYMEFEAPWYSQDYLKNICAEDKIYCITGSLSISMLRSIHATYFNKKVMVDYNIPDIYEIVNSGKWTIDREIEITGGLYRDLNGDSVADNDDFYGFRTGITWGNDGYWVSFDINFMSRDNDGNFYFDIETEKLSNALVKLNKLIWESAGTYNADHNDEGNIAAFASGNTFMLMSNIGYAEGEVLRSMTDEYGIIPLPKYDEEQENYYSNPSEIYQMFSIPVTVQNPDTVSAVLEALFAESWRKVVPIYSDVALKGKYMNDLESRKMFDLIINSICFEPALHYNDALMAIPDSLMSYPLADRSIDITSKLAKYNRTIPMLMKELNEALQ